MGILLAVISAIGYSLNYIFIQRGMRKSPKDNGSFISLFSCVLTILLIYFSIYLLGLKVMYPVSALGLLFFVIAGICTAFLGRTLLFSGIRKIGSSKVVSLKNSSPVFTIIFALLFLDEVISLLAGIGIAIIFFFLFLQAKYDFSKIRFKDESEDKSGYILAIIAALCFGFGQGFRKLGLVYYSDAILGSLIGSTVALFALILLEVRKKELKSTLARNFKSINFSFVAAGFVTGIAQVSFFISLLYTKVSYTSTITAIEPILTVILAKFFLAKEENIGFQMIITALAVFLGTIIIVIGQ